MGPQTTVDYCLEFPIAHVGVDGQVTVRALARRPFRPERLLIVRMASRSRRMNARASRAVTLTNVKVNGSEVLKVPAGRERTYLSASYFHPEAPVVQLAFWPVRVGQEIAVTLIDNDLAGDWSLGRLVRRLAMGKHRMKVMLIGQEIRQPELVPPGGVLLGFTATPMRSDGRSLKSSMFGKN